MEYQEIKRSIPQHDISVPIDSEVESERLLIQLQKYKIQQKEMELALRKQFMQQVKRTSLPYELTTQKIDIESAVQEILDSNKGLLPAHKANLPQTTAVAPTELQQANLIAAQKLLCSQPTAPNTTRFHEYSLEPSRSAWEGYQLPTRNYIHKLIALKRKLLSPEMKELLDFSPTTAQAPSSAATEEMDSILICGKGYRGSKHGLFLSHH
ncbi:uncharacterized protein LOC129337359 [Eublepharis macularius]|uniref:Uncharacterized protein LOC129337359 n=1 Tax=Eublepharis macularius TaxID=481883 RepID=A0AA97K0W8_EUBMA|nr:uncharacterized protein LOC129337359 [Eublepharis macularius]